MPNEFLRRASFGRGVWSEEDFNNAIREVQSGGMAVYGNSFIYLYSLQRRFHYTKGHMGPSSTFGADNRKRLSKHIKDMTIDDLKRISFEYPD